MHARGSVHCEVEMPAPSSSIEVSISTFSIVRRHAAFSLREDTYMGSLVGQAAFNTAERHLLPT